MLKRLPDELLAHVVAWLRPKDFYTVRSVIPISHSIYWGDDKKQLERAVQNACISLAKHRLLSGDELTQSLCLQVFCKPMPRLQTQLYTYYHVNWQPERSIANNFILTRPFNESVLATLIREKTWIVYPSDIPDILTSDLSMRDKFDRVVRLDQTGLYSTTEYLWMIINAGYVALFEYVIKKYSQFVTFDIIDNVYMAKKWKMMAVIFAWCPRLWIDYLFGSYQTATDPQLIKDLQHCLPHMKPYNRAVFAGILEKYHMWLWKHMLAKKNTLKTIEEINKLGLFEWNPHDYIDYAIESLDTCYIRYLLVNGMTVTAKDYLKASYFSNDVAGELYDHYMIQEANNWFIVILICWVLIMIESIYSASKDVKIIDRSKIYV